jgi:hypothetical protein
MKKYVVVEIFNAKYKKELPNDTTIKNIEDFSLRFADGIVLDSIKKNPDFYKNRLLDMNLYDIIKCVIIEPRNIYGHVRWGRNIDDLISYHIHIENEEHNRTHDYTSDTDPVQYVSKCLDCGKQLQFN